MDIKPKNYNRSRSKKGYKGKHSMNKAKNKTQHYYNSQKNINIYQGYNINSKKNLEEKYKDYQKFVKKFFGNLNPRDYMPEERMEEILEEKDKNNFDQNKIMQNEKNYLIYEKVLMNNKDCSFSNEEIEVQMPSADKFAFCENNRLGKHKNNKNDYNKRKKKLEKLGIIKNINKNIDNVILGENETNNSPEKEKETPKKNEEEIKRKKEEEIKRKKEEEKRKKEEEIKKKKEEEEKKKKEEEEKRKKEEEKRKKEEEEKKKKEEEEKNKDKEEEKRKKEEEKKKKEEEEKKKKEEEEKNKDKEDIEDKGDKPEEEEEKEIEEEDKVNENIAPAAKSPICDDYDTMQDKEIKAKKIQKIFREKRCGERLYLGMDRSYRNIIRIYMYERGQNNRIKSIKIYIYLLLDGELLILKKSIKELLRRDSISIDSFNNCVNEIIEKILSRLEDSINSNLLSEN